MLSGLQPFDELRLENLIDESSLLNKDDFDGAISRVVEDDAMAPDAEPIIARKGGFQGANVAAFLTQAGGYWKSMGSGGTCQIRSQYSRMARSDEK